MYLPGYIRGEISFCLCNVFGRLPLMCIALCFNAYPIIQLFFSSSTFVERIPGLGGVFIFNYISPTTPEESNARKGQLVSLSGISPQTPALNSTGWDWNISRTTFPSKKTNQQTKDSIDWNKHKLKICLVCFLISKPEPKILNICDPIIEKENNDKGANKKKKKICKSSRALATS